MGIAYNTSIVPDNFLTLLIQDHMLEVVIHGLIWLGQTQLQA